MANGQPTTQPSNKRSPMLLRFASLGLLNDLQQIRQATSNARAVAQAHNRKTLGADYVAPPDDDVLNSGEMVTNHNYHAPRGSGASLATGLVVAAGLMGAAMLYSRQPTPAAPTPAPTAPATPTPTPVAPTPAGDYGGYDLQLGKPS